MAFDTSELDAACMADEFTEQAVTVVNGEPFMFNVIFEEEAEYDEDSSFRINAGTKITAETLKTNYDQLDRNNVITINGNKYRVIMSEPRSLTWVAMVLERVKN